jgi:EAL domain-containing protein (putative c-di-GMP-specific phosphodiesterase class I)
MTSFTKLHAIKDLPSAATGCSGCKSEDEGMPLAFAFQPIIDFTAKNVFAHEALVRGPNGEGALSVLSQVNDENRYHFDQRCRTNAIEQAAGLGMESYLSINFMPNAVYKPEACIRSTLQAAEKFGFPIEKIIFETLESEDIVSRPHLVEIFKAYKQFGFKTAIDDFGSGYSGLTLLIDFQPDFVKIDMELVRGIDTHSVRQRIVRNLLWMCGDLGITAIAEGIETKGERDFFAAHGLSLMQGYFFAKPGFRTLPIVTDDLFLN